MSIYYDSKAIPAVVMGNTSILKVVNDGNEVFKLTPKTLPIPHTVKLLERVYNADTNQWWCYYAEIRPKGVGSVVTGATSVASKSYNNYDMNIWEQSLGVTSNPSIKPITFNKQGLLITSLSKENYNMRMDNEMLPNTDNAFFPELSLSNHVNIINNTGIYDSTHLPFTKINKTDIFAKMGIGSIMAPTTQDANLTSNDTKILMPIETLSYTVKDRTGSSHSARFNSFRTLGIGYTFKNLDVQDPLYSSFIFS